MPLSGVSGVSKAPSIEDIADKDWVYSVMSEERLIKMKRDGILNFISQWINMTSLFIFILTTEDFAIGEFSIFSMIYYIIILVMSNWTGSQATVSLWLYSRAKRAQRRYAVKHGLLPWWQQKEFGGWK
jgi:hypothetical protein